MDEYYFNKNFYYIISDCTRSLTSVSKRYLPNGFNSISSKFTMFLKSKGKKQIGCLRIMYDLEMMHRTIQDIIKAVFVFNVYVVIKGRRACLICNVCVTYFIHIHICQLFILHIVIIKLRMCFMCSTCCALYIFFFI
jgi:hypothetical protein